MRGQSSGWRSMPALAPITGDEPDTYEKDSLFEAGRLCAKALDLPSSCRFVLDQLCGIYGGMLIEGRMLVWPSNEFLVERTGIHERTLRLAIRRLLDLGVIAAKDSPNGKRFAQRDRNGQIVRAYGFDLTPLLYRLHEFKSQVQAQKDAQRERSVAFDQLTIHRRAAQEALRALAEEYPELDTAELTKRALELVRVTPRRSSMGSAEPYASQWQALRNEAEALYYTANAGENCRHKEHNKDAPDQSCNNGFSVKRVDFRASPGADAGDLAMACPDAMEFIGPVRSDQELIMGVARMRGAFGVSRSGWDDAIDKIGPLLTAATLVYVVQMQARPTPGSDPIKNAGGYFRAMVRLIADGRLNLSAEIRRLLRS